jgi:hypothetical protein
MGVASATPNRPLGVAKATLNHPKGQIKNNNNKKINKIIFGHGVARDLFVSFFFNLLLF